MASGRRGGSARARDFGRDYLDTPEGATLDTAALMDRRGSSIEWITRLLAATAARPGYFGCFGLHEWAMVYRTVEVRHGSWPLRLGGEEIAEVVEQRGVRCGHFDAFRFFTPEARPLNALQPTRERQPELEQPGCLHANMDLYKWAYKLSPLVSGELVADCFTLARDIRAVDMRASPYDLSSLGHRAIRVETPEGRAEYAAEQRGFAERAMPLRQRLLDAGEQLLAGTRLLTGGTRAPGPGPQPLRSCSTRVVRTSQLRSANESARAISSSSPSP